MAEISPSHPFLFWVALFFIGGALGSFLCACVRRVPKGLSVISPPSACESCSKPIPFYANTPVAGFIICLGACLRCGARISPLYPMVETLCAASAVIAVYVFGLSFEALRCFVFLYALIVAAAFDLMTMTVPDFITLSSPRREFCSQSRLDFSRTRRSGARSEEAFRWSRGLFTKP